MMENMIEIYVKEQLLDLEIGLITIKVGLLRINKVDQYKDSRNDWKIIVK